FVPSCSSELMMSLGKMALKDNLPVQSHLSENISEIKWVKELYPDSESYGHVYDDHNLFGQTATVMAHCIHLTNDELSRMKKNNVFIAHCPNSNINISIDFYHQLSMHQIHILLQSFLPSQRIFHHLLLQDKMPLNFSSLCFHHYNQLPLF
ncbi:MAG: Guanine deaminase, partial [Clostridium butyricum DORA_1]